MSYKTDSKRTQTMLSRVGEAADLIDNKAFLPFYRRVQILLAAQGQSDEWAVMIANAKRANRPSHYFARLCKMVIAGTYQFVGKVAEKVVEIANDTALYLHDKLLRFNFGKYQKYWVRKANTFVEQNSLAGFIELLEYAERKKVSQKYLARALANGKSPRAYYQENILGSAR